MREPTMRPAIRPVFDSRNDEMDVDWMPTDELEAALDRLGET